MQNGVGEEVSGPRQGSPCEECDHSIWIMVIVGYAKSISVLLLLLFA